MGQAIRVAGHTLWLDSKGVMHVRKDEEGVTDLVAARAVVAALRGVAGPRQPPLLCDLRAVHDMTTEARSFFARELKTATALLLDQPLTRETANLFNSLERHHVDMRMFCFQRDAEAWLQMFAA